MKRCLTLRWSHELEPSRLLCPWDFSQARMGNSEWAAVFLSRRSSWPRDWTHFSCISRRILNRWAPGKPKWNNTVKKKLKASWRFLGHSLSCIFGHSLWPPLAYSCHSLSLLVWKGPRLNNGSGDDSKLSVRLGAAKRGEMMEHERFMAFSWSPALVGGFFFFFFYHWTTQQIKKNLLQYHIKNRPVIKLQFCISTLLISKFILKPNDE